MPYGFYLRAILCLIHCLPTDTQLLCDFLYSIPTVKRLPSAEKIQKSYKNTVPNDLARCQPVKKACNVHSPLPAINVQSFSAGVHPKRASLVPWGQFTFCTWDEICQGYSPRRCSSEKTEQLTKGQEWSIVNIRRGATSRSVPPRSLKEVTASWRA